MSMEPPPFQEAARCDVCNCSFNTFRRRHHCRCCGRTLCNEHSSSQMALPQFGVHSSVRVCADCFNNSRSAEDGKVESVAVTNGRSITPASSDRADLVADKVSELDINTNPDLTTNVFLKQNVVTECKCGMPLCICEAPESSKDTTNSQAVPITTYNTAKDSSKPKRKDTPKSRSTASNSKLCSVFNPGSLTKSSSDDSPVEYEVNGEGLREAIKNGDAAAVKKLLSKGVDANYRDKQGLSLLHLAALFNKADIAFELMDHGSSIDFRNSHGETPLDCAPATLQYKMQKKIDEMGSMNQPM